MEYTIQQVNFGKEISGEKNGKAWSGHNVGLKIDDIWYNSILSGSFLDFAMELKEGDKVELELSEKENPNNPESPYKKFKITGAINVGNETILNRRVKALEDDIMSLKRQVSDLYDIQNGVIPSAPKTKKSNESVKMVDKTKKKKDIPEDFDVPSTDDDMPF